MVEEATTETEIKIHPNSSNNDANDANDANGDGATSAHTPGIVLRAGRGLYTVQTADGQILACRLRGNLKKNLVYPESTNLHHRVGQAKKRQETDPVAVGERVTVAQDKGGAVIESIQPRYAALTRRSGNERERQTIVANLELAVIVFSASEPRPDLYKLDRFLVLADDAELCSLIVLNKAELVTEADIAAVAEPYRRIGYDFLATSAKTGAGIAELQAYLSNKVSAFCGPSGVGKSSLVNTLQPGLSLKTSEVGLTTFKGRHTTVAVELLPLTFGGWVADTPGLRQIEFWDLAPEDIGYCMPDFVPFLNRCKFPNCRHRQEPACAIRAAVDAGAIDPRRYQSYLEMTK